MQLRKLLLPGLLSVTLLSGCSLFNSEEDVVKMSPLPTVENQFTPSTSWSTSVGDGIGEFYSNLHPAFADGVVYAADRKGTVKALNADDGKEVWSVNLAEKDGWFSRTPALLSGGGDRLWRPCLYRQRESAAVCAEYQRWYRGLANPCRRRGAVASGG